MQVQGKIVVVTGAAQGIGRALCERFHRDGAAKVIAADLSAQGAADAAEAVGGLAFACDVSQADEVQTMVDRIEATVGPIALYCSNAGILERDPDFDDAASASEASWTRSWNVNVMGHGHAARGTSRKGPWKKGTNAKLKSATHPSITGRNLPSPHAGDHFCTSTSKIANIVAEQAE